MTLARGYLVSLITKGHKQRDPAFYNYTQRYTFLVDFTVRSYHVHRYVYPGAGEIAPGFLGSRASKKRPNYRPSLSSY